MLPPELNHLPRICAPQQIVTRIYERMRLLGVKCEANYEKGDAIASDQAVITPEAEFTLAYKRNFDWAVARYVGHDDPEQESINMRALARYIGMVAEGVGSRRLWLFREDVMPHQIPRKPNLSELLGGNMIETWSERDQLTYGSPRVNASPPPAISAEPLVDDDAGLLS
jgi:hypothetical protein